MSKARRRRSAQLTPDDLLDFEKLRGLKSGTDVEIASYRGENLKAEVRLRVRPAFDEAAFHPRIAAVSKRLYSDGHYRNAVLDACVALINRCRRGVYFRERRRRSSTPPPTRQSDLIADYAKSKVQTSIVDARAAGGRVSVTLEGEAIVPLRLWVFSAEAGDEHRFETIAAFSNRSTVEFSA